MIKVLQELEAANHILFAHHYFPTPVTTPNADGTYNETDFWVWRATDVTRVNNDHKVEYLRTVRQLTPEEKDVLINTTLRRLDWAEKHSNQFPIPWIKNNEEEWKEIILGQAQGATLSYWLNRSLTLQMKFMSVEYKTFLNEKKRACDLIANKAIKPFAQSQNWLHTHTLAWFLRLVEEEHDKDFSTQTTNKELFKLYNQYLNDQSKRILLKAYAFDSLILYIKYLIKKTIDELKLDEAKTFEEITVKLNQLITTKLPQPDLPQIFPQQTFMESRAMQKAIADGHRLSNWQEVEGEIALAHVIKGHHIQTKLASNSNLDWTNLPTTYESLKNELKQCDLTTVLLLNVAIGCVLHQPQTTISIDTLCNLIGLTRREKIEREKAHQKVWRWLMLFDSMTVHGKRPGKYRDPVTRKEIDLTSSDALIKLTGKRFDKQNGTNSDVPIDVSFVAGPWLDPWRGNSQILQYFGDISKIAKISSGKASGALAQSIGLALNQLWREQSSRTKICYAGENNKLTAQFEPFTRSQLLGLFPCDLQVEKILESDKPHRAKEYWAEAIRKLKVSIISHYAEIDQMPETRTNWQHFWFYDQRLDIRPKQDAIEFVANVSRKAKARRQKPTQQKKKNV
jgi:hypothetical protein